MGKKVTYAILKGSESIPINRRFTVVDSNQRLDINSVRAGQFIELFCNCSRKEDAEAICAALNAGWDRLSPRSAISAYTVTRTSDGYEVIQDYDSRIPEGLEDAKAQMETPKAEENRQSQGYQYGLFDKIDGHAV